MEPEQERQVDADKIDSVNQLPVKERRRTDLFCAIFLAVYVILLALILLFVYNKENLNKITYPTDNEGHLCGYDYPTHPYVYYTTTTDPTKRLCVNKCPKEGDTQLSCKPTDSLGCRKNSNPKYEVTIYDTYLDEGRIGLFCLPTDSSLKDVILKLSNTDKKYHILSVMDSFWTSAWISALCGISFFLLAQLQPYKLVPWVILTGGVFSIIFAIFVLTLTAGYFLAKLLLSILFLVLGIISLKTLATSQRRDSVVVCSQLLHGAALTHSERDDTGHPGCTSLVRLAKAVLLILAFLFIYFLFFYINIREVLSVWSVGKLEFVKDQPFYKVVGFSSNFLMILVVIQLIWGAFFIKEAFNFIAASHAVDWYFGGSDRPSFLHSTELLLRYHLGSVVGGSLLQGFFYFVDLLLDFFFSTETGEDEASTGVNQKHYLHPIDYDRTRAEDGHCCTDFFNLIRNEALAYVALTNKPYCDSARYMEFLASNSRFYNYGQTTNRMFRINMHIVPIFIVLCISIGNMGVAATPYAIMLIAVLCYFIITYFLSYHAEKTEGLLAAIYVDEALKDGELDIAPQVMKIMYEEDIYNKHKGIGVGTLLCNEGEFAIKEKPRPHQLEEQLQ